MLYIYNNDRILIIQKYFSCSLIIISFWKTGYLSIMQLFLNRTKSTFVSYCFNKVPSNVK